MAQSKINRRKFIKNTIAVSALSMVGGNVLAQGIGRLAGATNGNMNATGYTEPSKTIPVYGSWDTVVVGGGPAGWAAALASARNGARTLVIERFAFFGGTGTASLMLNINGYRNQVKPDDLQTSKGIAQELILGLKEIRGLGTSTTYGAEQYPTTPGKLTYSYPIDSEKTKFVMLRLLHEAGVDVLFHTAFAAPIMEGNRVAGVIIENKSGRQAVYAKVVVDASGDGDVAYRAGAPWWQAGADDKHLKNCLMYKVSMNPASTPKMKGVITNNDLLYWGPTLDFDATDAGALSRGEVEARLKVYDHFHRAQRAAAPLLDDAYINETAPLMGIRQTRFIKGLYTTSNDDAISGRRFDDSVAMSACPIIEYYGYRRYLEHTGYEIPYRCLLPQQVEGLLLAGRCISSDQQSYESWRAMAPVMCIGEAAGTAAALCAGTERLPKELDVEMLRARLIERGAEIGQNKKD